VFSASKPLLAIWHYMFLLVAEKILVPISVISVIRLSLFVLRHNYLSMCSLGRNLCSSGRNMVYSWRWIMGGGGSHQLPSICDPVASLYYTIVGLTDIWEYFLQNKSCSFWNSDSENVNKIKIGQFLTKLWPF
jgi:hypothetical protein